MAESNMRHKSSYIAVGVILGAVGGLVAGMLTAPRSGKDTRRQLTLRARDAKSQAQLKMAIERNKLMSKLNKAKASAKDKAKELSEKV